MGQNGSHQVNLSEPWEHQKQNCEKAKFNWEPMELFENRRCLCVFVTVCDTPSKCVLNTLQVENGQTPEEWVAKVTTHQGISLQDSSIICQILSNPPEITHLNEGCLTDTANMISKGKISIKPDTKVLYNSC